MMGNIASKFQNVSSFLAQKSQAFKNYIGHKIRGLTQPIATTIPDEVKKQARFADLSYSRDVPLNTEFGVLDKRFTDDDLKTYINPASKHVHVSIRGTDLASPERSIGRGDILTNIFGAIGKKDEGRYATTNQQIQNIKKAYPDHAITTYGFSLGGNIGQEISRRNPDVKSVSFNPVSSIVDAVSTAPKNTTVHAIQGDPLSFYSRGQEKVEYEKPTSLYKHGIASFYE
jgi:hypothetical protein